MKTNLKQKEISFEKEMVTCQTVLFEILQVVQHLMGRPKIILTKPDATKVNGLSLYLCVGLIMCIGKNVTFILHLNYFKCLNLYSIIIFRFYLDT